MSQRSRRDSTQVPEAGPSTSRRASTRVVDVDEDEGEQLQPRRSKGNNTSSKRRIQENDEDEGEGEDEEDQAGDDPFFGELALPLPPVDVDEEFHNVPLKKDEALVKLQNAIKEWREVQRRLATSMTLLATTTSDVQEAVSSGDPDEEASLAIKEADAGFRQMLNKMYEAKAREEALDSLRGQLQGENAPANPLESVEAAVKAKLDAFHSQTSRQKYLEDTNYKNFRELVWEAQSNGLGFPNMKTFIPREEGDPESDDEDVELQAVAQNYKDPISMAWLEKPVKSTVCKHVYSRATITALIKESATRVSAGCPVSGCNKIITLSSLEDDPQLEHRVQQAKRREAEKEGRGGADGYEDIDDDDDEDEEES